MLENRSGVPLQNVRLQTRHPGFKYAEGVGDLAFGFRPAFHQKAIRHVVPRTMLMLNNL